MSASAIKSAVILYLSIAWKFSVLDKASVCTVAAVNDYNVRDHSAISFLHVLVVVKLRTQLNLSILNPEETRILYKLNPE